ncbi:hypothetical protein GF312_11450 [Candidatus Poribacteria bacterium]|nr:hypothetical protein [Candidatus Poribacteria bacterium]
MPGNIEKEIIRIGLPIRHETNLYPMVKPQKTCIETIKTVKGDGVEIWNMHLTSLDCTYIETRRHISTHGPLPMEIFSDRPEGDLYKGIVVHLDIEPGGEISPADLGKYLDTVKPGDALVVDAGEYTDKWLEDTDGIIDTDDYNLNSPYFSPQAMQDIIDAEVAVLAGNFPSFSNPRTHEGFGIDMIAEFYKTEHNMILAPLVNLGEIQETEIVLQINPLDIEGCCGIPCNPSVYQGKLKSAFLDFIVRLS